MTIRRFALPITLAAGLAITSCGTDGDTASSGDGPRVLASFYPLAFVAERVAGSDASVVNLTQAGADAHDMELTAQQVAQVTEADLVLHLDGFQPAVDEAIEQNSDHGLDVTGLIELLPAGEDEHADEDEDEHADEDEDAHDLDGDPHIWLDPANMSAIAEAVADELAEIAPDAADAFHDRARELVEELTELDTEFTSGLADCARTTFVTSHAAFGYLAEKYGLEMVGITGIEPETEPSPARLAEVQEVVEHDGITTIFYERLVSPAVAESLANDAGVATAVLDPIEGLTDETADEDYFTLMRANLDALEEANGCA